MTIPSRTSARLALTVVTALAAAACGPAAPPPGGTGPAPAIGIPGDSLHRLANNSALWSAPRTFERKCTGSARCGWPVFRKKVKVDIAAEVGARNVGPNPPSMTLIGKLENRGDATEAMYGLENGPYDYLVFVYPVSGSANGRWVIQQVGKAPPYPSRPVSHGIQVGCNHPRSWNSSFGEFRSCDDGPPPNPPASAMRGSSGAGSAVRMAGFNPFAFLKLVQGSMMGELDPAWFTCTSGCCVADQPQLF